MSSFLYGLDLASHDFSDSVSLGKNIFTNAFPLSLGQFLAIERGLPIPTIKAVKDASGRLTTAHEMTPWADIIGTNPENAYFQFEGVFKGYDQYTHGSANKSDVVVLDSRTREHLRPLEIKLVVVPTSSTARKPRNQQSCEIVSRPSTVEQVAFSIAHSYGASRRYELLEIIQTALGQPNDYEWADSASMIRSLPEILAAAETIINRGIDIQTPLVMTAIWRSQGQKPALEEQAFDVFVWTEMAFLQLYMDATRRAYFDTEGKRKAKLPKEISRPARALIWLVKSLWDYTTQQSLDFDRVHSQITYGVQSDKAASFAGQASLRHMASEELFNPRVHRDELDSIIRPEALEHLLPERRLDAALSIQYLVNQQRADQ